MDDFVFVVDEELRPVGCRVALGLRRQGRRVDLGLDARRIKWAFKVPSTRSPLFSTASFLARGPDWCRKNDHNWKTGMGDWLDSSEELEDS